AWKNHARSTMESKQQDSNKAINNSQDNSSPEDAEVMDYAKFHRKPPIHNVKTKKNPEWFLLEYLTRKLKEINYQGVLWSPQDLVRSKVLSNVDDRWAWDLNGGGDFCVKDARDLVDEVLLPKENVVTRWIKTIPIKVNVFGWKLHLDRLPTRSNLLKRGIQVQSSLCPICNVLQEDTSHLFFSCDVALAISRLICRWWNVSWSPVDSYSGWLEWFNSIRLGSKLKGILEGVFYVSWWCLWNFRNQLLFASKKPRKETLFDDVVSRSFIWSNSRNALMNDGFVAHVNVSYLGELWVLLEFSSVKSKEAFRDNVGVSSWFSEIRQASFDYHYCGRIVWVEIEGVPLKL
ncbi:RNA-directed DNA polymerase, eukaryota, partial [Tanacetum coccineum]